jgi:hypothetical protein
MKELKPCPFCGSSNVKLATAESYGGYEPLIFCECNATLTIGWFGDGIEKHYVENMIYETWNSRSVK